MKRKFEKKIFSNKNKVKIIFEKKILKIKNKQLENKKLFV